LLQEKLQDQQCYQIGKKCWVTLCSFQSDQPFPTEQILRYQFISQQSAIDELLPQLLYENASQLNLVIKERLDEVLDGSCRNPHHCSKDSLVATDNKVSQLPILERPALLMLSGDQIYADHVAGPLLLAIQKVIRLLGLNDEQFDNPVVEDSN
jgi:hypothetical protein